MIEVPKLVEAYPGLPAGVTKVEQGSWETAQVIAGEQPLGTLAISTCTIVAVRNIETARAYLGHFFHPHSRHHGGNREEFEAMVKAIVENEDPVHELEIWLSGTSQFGDRGRTEEEEIHDASIEADREIVFSAFYDLPHETSIKVDWLNDNEGLSAVTFNPMGKEAVIEYLTEPVEADDFGGEDDGKKSPPAEGLKNLTGLITRKLSEREKTQLEEVSYERLLDQLNQGAPEDAVKPSRLKNSGS